MSKKKVKADLIKDVASSTGASPAMCELMLISITKHIKKYVKNGHNIEIRGFGAFNIKSRAERKGRMIRTEGYPPVSIPETKKLVFKSFFEI